VLGPIAEGDRVMEYAYRDVSSIGVFFYHDTHQYFEQAYAMKIVGHVASPPGSTSGNVNGVIALKNWLAESPQPCLFTEYAYEEPHLDLLLANSDVTPIELDSLGSQLPPGPDLYVQLMQRNFSAISNCVEGLKPEQKKPRSQASNSPDAALFPSEVTPRYLLIDQDGDTVTNSDFLGQFQLIYFGYTYCPDICPTSLSHLAQAMQLLGPQADEVQPLFITVDPERDTPQVLQRYVSYFHPRLLGLSGSPAITKRTAENFKAPFEKVPSESGDPQRYSMDHSAGLYLIGRNGEFLTKFAHGFPADKMAERIRAYMRDAG
jgi:protein SCO1/2